MTSIHTPELSGIKAVYTEDGSLRTFERPVLGWDKLGRPLVMCGDRLYPADAAPFANYPAFLDLTGPETPDWRSLLERIWYDKVEWVSFTDIIETAVRDAVYDRLRTRDRERAAAAAAEQPAD